MSVLKVSWIIVVLSVITKAEYNLDSIIDPNIYVEPHGEAPSETRIIGGSEATPNSFPYQVALFIEFPHGRSFCGGSLISNNYVLTAAHCMDKAKAVDVLLGAHDIRKNESTQLRLSCDSITVHPNWNYEKLENDIALIKLPHSVSYNTYVNKIDLSNTGTFTESLATLTGWGKTTDYSKVSEVLNQVNLPVLDNSDCTNYYENLIQSTHVCTSGAEIKGGCNGDSGGPLVLENQQIGIVSFGSNRCTKGYPTVFTRVSEFKDWISKNSDVLYE
ncbi:brachyurin-like [Sitophilus oryzae]|uniref:Brachyurin-like n=1 Tax=Sitophilus oryzae TaxID=7048 RepID=A0A6J2XRB0_SITOR|nr:brachyurin-like [Sitophilus oryzae]